MPVATIGDCGAAGSSIQASGGPNSNFPTRTNQQHLHKFWANRKAASFHTAVEIEPFQEESDDLSSVVSDSNITGNFRRHHGPGCRRKDSLDLAHSKARETLFDSPLEGSSKRSGGGRFGQDKTPLLALRSLGCSLDAASNFENLLPLDLIQNSGIRDIPEWKMDNQLRQPIYSHSHPHTPVEIYNSVENVPISGISPVSEMNMGAGGVSNTTTSTNLSTLTHNKSLNKCGCNKPFSYCSCKKTFKPRLKSYEETIRIKTGRDPLSSAADPRTPVATTTCWCWSSKLVLYTIYLCIVFILVIFTEAARVVVVPITVFLIVLSLALFLFILFCVCFIIFI